MRALLADVFALDVKTMTDEIAERARKLGGTTLRSVGDIDRHQRPRDDDADEIGAIEMLSEL
jgi:starvation-inducible DNA-binding protein